MHVSAWYCWYTSRGAQVITVTSHPGVSNHRGLDSLTVGSDLHKRKHPNPSNWPFVRGIYRWTVDDSPHKGPVTRKPFPFDDVMIYPEIKCCSQRHPHPLCCNMPFMQVSNAKFLCFLSGQEKGFPKIVMVVRGGISPVCISSISRSLQTYRLFFNHN